MLSYLFFGTQTAPECRLSKYICWCLANADSEKIIQKKLMVILTSQLFKKRLKRGQKTIYSNLYPLKFEGVQRLIFKPFPN